MGMVQVERGKEVCGSKETEVAASGKVQNAACQQRLKEVEPDQSGTQKRTYENYRSHFYRNNGHTVPLAGGSADLRHQQCRGANIRRFGNGGQSERARHTR